MMSAAVRMAEEGAGFAFVDVFGVHSSDRQKLAFRRFEPRVFFEYSAIWLEHREADTGRSGVVALLKQVSIEMMNEAEKLLDLS